MARLAISLLAVVCLAPAYAAETIRILAGNHLRFEDPDGAPGARLRARRQGHEPRRTGQVHGGAGRRRAQPHQGVRVRGKLGRAQADLRRRRLRGQHPQAGRDQDRDPAHRRSAQNAGSGSAQADRRVARRGLALLRRPRQRDFFSGRRAADRLPPAGRAQRQDRGRRALEGGGADRSARRTPTAATAS